MDLMNDTLTIHERSYLFSPHSVSHWEYKSSSYRTIRSVMWIAYTLAGHDHQMRYSTAGGRR